MSIDCACGKPTKLSICPACNHVAKWREGTCTMCGKANVVPHCIDCVTTDAVEKQNMLATTLTPEQTAAFDQYCVANAMLLSMAKLN